MKKLLLLAFLATVQLYSQDFEVGATMAGGLFIKTPGKIYLTDNFLVTEISSRKGQVEISDYDIINERNGVTYVSDGIDIFKVSIVEARGKKKGFLYDREIYLTTPQNITVVYYAKQI